MRRVRSVASVAGLAAATLLLGIAPATATTPAATTPTAPTAALTGGPHVMPMRPTTGSAGTARSAAVTAASPPIGSHLTYYGGRVVSHTEVVQVLWGAGIAGAANGQYLSQVLNTPSPSVATFYQGVLNSSYVDWLSEYTTSTQTIGRGSFAAQYTITPSTSASTVDDTTIQSELSAQILGGHLPAPHQDAAGNNNTYYAIFFPHGKQITVGTSSSCVSGGFVAYHGTIAHVGVGGPEIYYGVHPDMQAGSGCQGQGQTNSVFGDVTAVASHELVETMTDPEVGIAPSVGPPLAWYDLTNGEIGDICNAMPGSTTGSDGLTYFVQTQWSNAQNTCAVGAPPKLTSASSATFTAGAAGTFTVTTTGAPAPSLSETGALPSGVSFVDNGNGTATFSGTPAAGTGGSYPLTLKAHNGVGADATQSFTVVVKQAAAITSGASATFGVGTSGTVAVTSTGSPVPALSETGALPSGVALVDNGNGTATLSGTPAGGSEGVYAVTLKATNGVGVAATQAFTLMVTRQAAVTSAASTTFVVGSAGTFVVTTAGVPRATIAESGALPTGVSFADNGNGTGTLSGTPAAGQTGSFPVTFTAHNGIGADAVQPFVLHVDPAVVSTTPPAIDSQTATVPATIGDPVTITVHASGLPVPTLSTSSVLPSGLALLDHGDGSATLSGVPLPGSAGIYTVVVTAGNGVGSSVAESLTVVVSRRATSLRYDGPTTGRYASSVTLAATLLDTETGAPVGSRTVHLELGSQRFDAATAVPTGAASGSVTLTQPRGTVGLAAGFDGDPTYDASAATVGSGFAVTTRAAVVSTGPGYLRQLTAVRGTAAAFTVRATVRRPLDAPAGDLGSVPSVQVRLVPIAGGAVRTCAAAPGSSTSRMTRTAAGDWAVACRVAAGLPLGVYEVVMTVGANAYWTGATADVLLVAAPTTVGTRGAGVLTGAGLPAHSSVAFAFQASRAGRGGRSVVGHVVSVLSVTDPVSGLASQHVLTSRSVTALAVRAARAPFTATLSGTGRWDSSTSVRFALALQDTTGGARDRDRYGQVISAPAAGSAGVSGLLRLRAVVVGSGDIAVR